MKDDEEYTPVMHAERSMNLAVAVFTLAKENPEGKDTRAQTALAMFKGEDPRVVGTGLQFLAALLASFLSVDAVIGYKNEVLDELAKRHG